MTPNCYGGGLELGLESGVAILLYGFILEEVPDRHEEEVNISPHPVVIDWNAPQPVDARGTGYEGAGDLRTATLEPEDIDQIERELRLRIPSFLRAWMRANPFEGFIDEPDALTFLRDALIADNVRLRRNGYYGREWPSHLFWIGNDGGGGAYFVESGREKDRIYYYDWNEGIGSVVGTENSDAETPQEFLESIKDLYNVPD